MAAKLMLSRTADKAQRKLDGALREKIKLALLEISANPTRKGERLSQPLTMVYSHHLKYKGKEFRIAYQYTADIDCIYVLLIGPHENFYQRVKNILYAS